MTYNTKNVRDKAEKDRQGIIERQIKRDMARALAPDVSDVRCAECKYWLKIAPTLEHADSGSCRRYPPVFDPSWVQEVTTFPSDDGFDTGTDTSYWVRPVVDKNSFCGEYVRREDD